MVATSQPVTDQLVFPGRQIFTMMIGHIYSRYKPLSSFWLSGGVCIVIFQHGVHRHY